MMEILCSPMTVVTPLENAGGISILYFVNKVVGGPSGIRTRDLQLTRLPL